MVLSVEQDRLVSPPTLATNYAITRCVETSKNGRVKKKEKKKIDGQKRVAPSKAVTNLCPLFGERESSPERHGKNAQASAV